MKVGDRRSSSGITSLLTLGDELQTEAAPKKYDGDDEPLQRKTDVQARKDRCAQDECPSNDGAPGHNNQLSGELNLSKIRDNVKSQARVFAMRIAIVLGLHAALQQRTDVGKCLFSRQIRQSNP